MIHIIGSVLGVTAELQGRGLAVLEKISEMMLTNCA
jgi:hypothetical protein